MRSRALLAAALALAGATGTRAQDGFDPATLDLAAMIACEADVPTYSGLAFFLEMEPGAVEALGWSELAGANPFLREFGLDTPLEVFGHSTARIAFSATGPMAILDAVEPAALADAVGARPAVAAPGQFLAERIVFEEVEEDKEAGMTFETRIALNVATVETHPGVVLAGCSYRIEIR